LVHDALACLPSLEAVTIWAFNVRNYTLDLNKEFVKKDPQAE